LQAVDLRQPAACREGSGRVANQRATSENFSGRERPAQAPNPVLTITTSMPGDPEIAVMLGRRLETLATAA
jgi:hypothetical protein